MSPNHELLPYRDSFEHLNDELRWLDLLIQLRTNTLGLQNQENPEGQTPRTVYITPEEVKWLLEQGTATHPENTRTKELRVELARLAAEIDDRVERTLNTDVFLALPQLGRLFGLSAFEMKTILICLAPELRRKYDRLYAYLQDDITRKRPSVDLVLELLCETEAERWHASRFFSDTAPLLRAALIQKVDDPHSPSGSSQLAQFLRLDPRICGFLLGNNQIETRLVDSAKLYQWTNRPPELMVQEPIVESVLSLVEHHLAPDNMDRRKLVIYLHGPYGTGKHDLALYTCHRLGDSLLSLDLEQLLAAGSGATELLHLTFREGLLHQAVLFLEHADVLLQDAARPLSKALEGAIAEYGWLIFLSGTMPWTIKEAFGSFIFQSVALPVPDVSLRSAIWRKGLAGRAADRDKWAGELAQQFRLTSRQIRAAIQLAENQVLMQPKRRPLTLSDVSAACRQQSNHKLSELAVKIEPHYGWNDIILSEDKLAHLREICSQVNLSYRVFKEWGFNKKLSRGKGLSVLFSGSPGTGKTMAAEVIAHELELDLYKIDLSSVVSKYIGETEKNLAKIFEEAETSNAILFFDEADALFGKRTEISDAHDRYANIETSYLLQKMEEYEGVVILASNLRENMDDAFIRRIRFIVEFPFPDEASRLKIWQNHFPKEAPISEEIDYEFLSRKFQIAGGNIKNIVLNSAFLAAANGGVITPKHIRHGAKREFEKMGKLWNE